MAIGTTPLFSKISGSVGPVDYRTRRNGKIEIGKKRIPANPQSTEQQNTRNAYGRLHELWQNAAWIDKTQYENIAAAYDISPWNAFLMRHLPIMRLNPVAYWPFVEGTGNTLHDFSPNNNHGTISGATWQHYGKFDIPYLYFDGIDDYVACGNDSSINLDDSYSWSAIINPADFSQIWPHVISKSLNYMCKLRQTRLATLQYYDGANWQLCDSTDKLQTGVDSSVTIVWDEPVKDTHIHFNGALSNSCNKTTSPVLTGTHLSLGNAIGGVGGEIPYNGGIKGAFGFNYALTTEQNTHIYNKIKKFYED